MNPSIEQWKNTLRVVSDDVTDLIENQHIFHRIGEVVTRNRKINDNNFFWDFLSSIYGAATVVGIARQVDKRTEVVSLIKLLESIRSSSATITKKWFADQYSPELRKLGEQHFVEHFGEGEALDVSKVSNDIEELLKKTSKIKRFRHTQVAHKNKDFNTYIHLSFEEVDEALMCLERTVLKYELLLNQSGMEGLMPVIQYDWEAVMRVPWIDEANKEERLER